MSEKQFVVEKLEILNEENEWKGEYWWAVVNIQKVEDCFECRNKEVALKLCDFLNKATDDFKWQIRQSEKWSAIVKQLKREKEEFKQEIKQYWKCRDKWKQEAKELKKEADYFERKKCEYWNMYNEAHSDRIILKKENEQLRLELETHKHPLWSTREAERKLSEVTDNLADEVKKNGLLNEELNQLRIENMRLKKKVGNGV